MIQDVGWGFSNVQMGARAALGMNNSKERCKEYVTAQGAHGHRARVCRRRYGSYARQRAAKAFAGRDEVSGPAEGEAKLRRLRQLRAAEWMQIRSRDDQPERLVHTVCA